MNRPSKRDSALPPVDFFRPLKTKPCSRASRSISCEELVDRLVAQRRDADALARRASARPPSSPPATSCRSRAGPARRGSCPRSWRRASTGGRSSRARGSCRSSTARTAGAALAVEVRAREPRQRLALLLVVDRLPGNERARQRLVGTVLRPPQREEPVLVVDRDRVASSRSPDRPSRPRSCAPARGTRTCRRASSCPAPARRRARARRSCPCPRSARPRRAERWRNHSHHCGFASRRW